MASPEGRRRCWDEVKERFSVRALETEHAGVMQWKAALVEEFSGRVLSSGLREGWLQSTDVVDDRPTGISQGPGDRAGGPGCRRGLL
jgi:hypothetical protein